jgi:hypothetical protein
LDNVWLGCPIERYKVLWERGGRSSGNNRAVSKEEKRTACEGIWAHANSKFSFGFGIGCGVVVASKGMAFVGILSYHATAAERKGASGGFIASEELIWS